MPGDLLGVDGMICEYFLGRHRCRCGGYRRLLRDGVDGGRSLLLRRVVLNLHLDLRNCSLHLHLLLFRIPPQLLLCDLLVQLVPFAII
jgi:hypothetical protein